MKHLKTFESLSYSGGNVEKMPIIGKVITKPIANFDEATYDIVEIIQGDGKDIYVVNSWYKNRIPQLIHSDLVKEYIPA